MTSALAVGGVAIAIAAGGLGVICWKRRTVLGGLLAGVCISLVAFAFGSGLTGSNSKAALVIALILLVVGMILYLTGQAFEWLLEDAPDDPEPVRSPVSRAQ